jgi:hypothetical protein
LKTTVAFGVAVGRISRLERRWSGLPGNQASMVLTEDFPLSKGLAMLIRSEKFGVRGGAAKAAPALPAASLPTLLIGGLLLICP